MTELVSALAVLLAATASFVGGRMSRRQQAAQVTLAEVNAFDARLDFVTESAAALAKALDEVRARNEQQAAELVSVRGEMAALKDYYERHIAEIHTFHAEEFERLAGEHRKQLERIESRLDGGGGGPK